MSPTRNRISQRILMVTLVALFAVVGCSDDPNDAVNNNSNANQNNNDPNDNDEPTSCEMTSWECEEFEDGFSLTVRRHGHESVVLDDGRVLLLGGSKRAEDSHASTSTNTWEIVDPDTEEIEDTGERPVNREYFAAVKLDTGSVMTVGGEFNHNPLTSIDHFDPETHEWSAELPEMDRPANSAVVLDDGRVGVVGVDSSHSEVYGQAFEAESLEWSELEVESLDISDIEDSTIEILPDGQAVVAVTYVKASQGEVDFFDTRVFVFDLLSGQLEMLEEFELEQPHVLVNADWLPTTEKVLVHIRTLDIEQNENPAVGYLFDPATEQLQDQYNRDPSPGSVRTVLPGDEVIFEDGFELQLYDVPTETWRTFPPLPDGIYYSSMDILPDCRMFLSGERTLGVPNEELREVDTGFCHPVDDDDDNDGDNGNDDT